MTIRSMPFEAVSAADPGTGLPVTRVFPPGRTACHAYFTSTSFDGKGRLILSAHVDGRPQLVRVDLAERTADQLTDLAHVQMQRYCVCPARGFAVVLDGPNKLIGVNLATGECHTLFDGPPGWSVVVPTVDAAGARIAFSLTEDPPGKMRAAYRHGAEQFFFRPRSLIFVVELDTGRSRAVWGDNQWISHVLIHPRDPDLVVFCHEGGGFVHNRLWLLNLRRWRKCRPAPLYEEEPHEELSDEYFLPDGRLGVQHTRHAAESNQRATNSILFLNTDGKILRNYALPADRSGHVQSNAGNSLIVADRYCPSWDVSEEEAAAHLALNVPGGQVMKVSKLCRHGSSRQDRLSHPHPIFSPDGSAVLFSSDCGGSNSVYLVGLWKIG